MTLRSQIKRDEDLRLKPYRDTTGHLTIGYGRNLETRGITLTEAEAMLTTDINEHEAALRRALPWTDALSECRRAVLVNMAINMGLGGLLGFRKMLAALEAGDYVTAAAEMLDSTWATQVKGRAPRLAEQMATDTWV